MAKLYRVNGQIEDVKPANGSDFTLEELYALVDTNMVETLPTNDGRIMVICEEGKLRGKEENARATLLTVNVTAGDDMIVGNALVCDQGELQ